DPQSKRMVLALLGSNLTIKEKTACIDGRNAFLFLKQMEKVAFEKKQQVEPKKGLSLQANQIFLEKQSDLAEESVLCSNLQQSITPELILQIKSLKEHMEKKNLARC